MKFMYPLLFGARELPLFDVISNCSTVNLYQW